MNTNFIPRCNELKSKNITPKTIVRNLKKLRQYLLV